MIYLVQSVIGTNRDVAISEWQNESGSWLIGVSKLGVTTTFGSGDLLKVTPQSYPGVDLCELTAAEVGMTPQQFEQMQVASYTYSVLVYSYTMTTAEYQAVNALLTQNEPARSQHYIFSGLDPNDHI